MRYSDKELRAVANAAAQLASRASTLRQAIEPRDVRHWAQGTCFSLWRLASALSPARFRGNIWETRQIPALLRPEWTALGGVLTRILWAAERIAPCVGVYQLSEYQRSKLALVADEYVFGFVERIRSDELAESIKDLDRAAGALADGLPDIQPDIPKKISHRKQLIETFIGGANKAVAKGKKITDFARSFAEKHGCDEENLLRAWRRSRSS